MIVWRWTCSGSRSAGRAISFVFGRQRQRGNSCPAPPGESGVPAGRCCCQATVSAAGSVLSVRLTAFTYGLAIMSSNGRRREVIRMSDVFRKIACIWSHDSLVTTGEKEGPLITGQYFKKKNLTKHRTTSHTRVTYPRPYFHYSNRFFFFVYENQSSLPSILKPT